MALAVEVHGAGDVDEGTNSITFAHAPGSISDGYLFCFTWQFIDDDSVPEISTITHNGDAVSLEDNYLEFANFNRMEIWKRAAPDASGNIVATADATCDTMACSAVTLSGVDQTTPNRTVQQGGGGGDNTDRTVSVTSDTDEIAIAHCFAFDDPPTGGNGTRVDAASGEYGHATTYIAGDSPSVDINFTGTEISQPHSLSVIPAAAAGTAVPVFYHHQARHWRKM